MQYESRYEGRSGIANGLDRGAVGLATNTLRETTYFQGVLRDPLRLREGLAALYDVVVSDFRYKPKDRLEFFAWLEKQDRIFLANLGVKKKEIREQMEKLEARKAELDRRRGERLQPFYAARKKFFDHIYTNEYELWYLLDPVITVHPDELSFEAFSRDESTYARLGVNYHLFSKIDSFECGTTNIDFSSRLHGGLERMRTYRETSFEVNPSGFSVTHNNGEAVLEKKIDLPDSWVMGFLQVHSAMSLALTHIQLQPVELYNLCRFLRRHRAKKSPRSIRFELRVGAPVRVVLEPWDHALELDAVYEGEKDQVVRVWGRDRLRVIERLLPVSHKVDLYLSGSGLPSLYVFDLGPLTFTLGLSGWTENDWTGENKFGLLTRRLEVSNDELSRAYDTMHEIRFGKDSEIAAKSGLGMEKARSALSYLCQVGRCMLDLGGGGVYRHRDLFPEPFSPAQSAKLIDKAADEANPRAKEARAIFESDNVRIIARRQTPDGYKISGSSSGTDGKQVRPQVHVNETYQIIDASCTCSLHKKNKLTQGPCQHILALRLAHMSVLEQVNQ